jgi:hypothetical protein
MFLPTKTRERRWRLILDSLVLGCFYNFFCIPHPKPKTKMIDGEKGMSKTTNSKFEHIHRLNKKLKTWKNIYISIFIIHEWQESIPTNIISYLHCRFNTITPYDLLKTMLIYQSSSKGGLFFPRVHLLVTQTYKA